MTTARGAVPSPLASTGLLRVMTLALGAGGIVFSLLSLPAFVEQAAMFEPAWSAVVGGSLALELTVMVTLAWRIMPSLLRALNGILAATYLLGLAVVVPGLHSETVLPASSERLWLVSLATIGASAAAVAWRRWTPWLYLVIVLVFIVIDETATHDSDSWDQVFHETAFDAFFAAVFIALAKATRKAGETLDNAATAAASETRSLARRTARNRERTRVNALVHDRVLVALFAAGRGEQGELTRREARRALEQIEPLGSEHTPVVRSGQDCAWELQALTTEISADAAFSYELGSVLSMPETVAMAIAEATAEALRNSMIHAGATRDSVSRVVHFFADANGIETTILDDGIGFVQSAVPATRLGIAVSIIGRMAGESGGHAVVVSKPGIGTRVTLRWLAP